MAQHSDTASVMLNEHVPVSLAAVAALSEQLCLFFVPFYECADKARRAKGGFAISERRVGAVCRELCD